jgi:hypothetical protein
MGRMQLWTDTSHVRTVSDNLNLESADLHLRYVSAEIGVTSASPSFTTNQAITEQKSMCVHVKATG